MSNRMETVREEEFANLENVTSTAEMVRHEEPMLVRLERLDTVASIDVRPMQKNLTYLKTCCGCFDLRIGVSTWITIEALFWIVLTVIAFYYEIMYIYSADLFEFFDWMESGYSLFVFGDENYFIDNRSRSLFIMFNLILIKIYVTYVICCILLLIGIMTCKISLIFPFVVLDLIFMTLAFGGCVAGVITWRFVGLHIFQISFIFLFIKALTEVHIISLMRRLDKLEHVDVSEVTSEVQGTTASV